MPIFCPTCQTTRADNQPACYVCATRFLDSLSHPGPLPVGLVTPDRYIPPRYLGLDPMDAAKLYFMDLELEDF